MSVYCRPYYRSIIGVVGRVLDAAADRSTAFVAVPIFPNSVSQPSHLSRPPRQVERGGCSSTAHQSPRLLGRWLRGSHARQSSARTMIVQLADMGARTVDMVDMAPFTSSQPCLHGLHLKFVNSTACRLGGRTASRRSNSAGAISEREGREGCG